MQMSVADYQALMADGNHVQQALVSLLGHHYTSRALAAVLRDFHQQQLENRPENNRAMYMVLHPAGRNVKWRE